MVDSVFGDAIVEVDSETHVAADAELGVVASTTVVTGFSSGFESLPLPISKPTSSPPITNATEIKMCLIGGLVFE